MTPRSQKKQKNLKLQNRDNRGWTKEKYSKRIGTIEWTNLLARKNGSNMLPTKPKDELVRMTLKGMRG